MVYSYILLLRAVVKEWSRNRVLEDLLASPHIRSGIVSIIVILRKK